MEPAPVALTRRALADIRAIERYSIAQWGRKPADRYIHDIEAALDRLAQNPALLSQHPEFATGVYFYRIRSHFLVCDYHEKAIVVLTIIHSSMDLPARLSELAPDLASEVAFLHGKLGG
jgi:plasmid stabilization system protein ParE